MSLWLQITSGRGPEECEWVVAQLTEKLLEEGRAAGLTLETLEAVPGRHRQTLCSALIAVEGEGAEHWAGRWQGTVLWTGKSPFRPRHKRKNWFVGIEKFSAPEATFWRESDLKIEVMRSSGPGGQHVNKTESAVRITHLPSGLSAIAREERSQQRNRRLALARLFSVKESSEEDNRDQARKNRWQQHNQLVRGNPVRVFAGEDFRER